MNHGEQPLSTLLWQAFYQHAQRETQINVLFIDSDPAVRLSLCGPVRLVVWAWLLAFFFCMSECVCLCLAVLWMDGNHAGMLYPAQNLWICCCWAWPGLPFGGHTLGCPHVYR